ncbi:MAG: hypothetical protein Q4B17_02815 [Lautropia sp.]|nr:hypothetical protein [Lautropia sp.]
MKSSRHFPLTAAALAVLLGACGGGGASDSPAGGATSAKLTDTPSGTPTGTRFGDVSLPTQAAVVTKTMPAQKPISAQAGVRGDVLLTMMDQIVCRNPEQSTSHNGAPVPGGQRVLPRMEVDQRLSPFNYEQIGGPHPSSRYMFHINGECQPEYFRYRAAQPGSYTWRTYGSPYFRGPLGPVPSPRFREHEIRVPLTVMTDSVSLSSVVKSNGVDLNSGREFSFRHDDRISWGVVQYWQHGSDYLKMLVVPGDNEGDARLCWNADNGKVKRLHCMTWRAPQGWKRGEPLVFVGQYLIDDRSVYPGEQGFLYARTF